MSVKTVLTYPDERLRRKGKFLEPSEIQDPGMQKLINDLIDTMIVDNGIGIAATQVGEAYQIFILGGKKKEDAKTFINPRITSLSQKETYMEEGCLSVPGVYGMVKRPAKVRMKALDRFGTKVDIKASGLTAKVFQHEVDHLGGILFIDKAECITLGDLEALKKGIVSPARTQKKDISL